MAATFGMCRIRMYPPTAGFKHRSKTKHPRYRNRYPRTENTGMTRAFRQPPCRRPIGGGPHPSRSNYLGELVEPCRLTKKGRRRVPPTRGKRNWYPRTENTEMTRAFRRPPCRRPIGGGPHASRSNYLGELVGPCRLTKKGRRRVPPTRGGRNWYPRTENTGMTRPFRRPPC